MSYLNLQPMEPDKIRAIINGKIKQLKKLSGKINNGFEQDAIHEFRVAVKSLRSFLRLLRMTYDDPAPKMTKKFKRLYNIAGAIRDAQLELDNLTANKKTMPVYTHKLTNDIERQKTEWERLYSGKIFRKMKKRLAGYEYETLSPDALAAFHNMKVTSIKKLEGTSSSPNSRIHNIRKHVKDILFTTKLAQKEWKPAYKQASHMPVEQLEHIAALIGDYNDERIQLEHLNSFSSGKTELTEINAIKEICKKDVAKLRTGKKEIMHIVKDFTGKIKASA